MLKKILIIAHTEAKANDAAALVAKVDPSLKVKTVYAGAKRVSRHFDAVVIYHDQVKEINFIKDEVQKYSEAPIKVFLGKATLANEAAAAHKTKAFTVGQLGDLLGFLKSSRGELELVMLKCFQVFDKDGNGYINASELKEVARELGRDLDAAEVDECLKDIDKDKDNKISFVEFSKWWLSGRQGLSPLMRNLLAFKLTSLKLLDTLSAPMKEVRGDANQQDAQDI
jgi:hypothetical protein